MRKLQTKYDEATEQVRELPLRKHRLQNSYDDLKRQLNKELPDLLAKTQRDVDATMWEQAVGEMKKDYSAIENYLNRILTPRQFDEFKAITEGSFFEDMALRGEEIAGVAAALFLGYIDQATTFAHSSGGGGGSPGSGLGAIEMRQMKPTGTGVASWGE